MALTQDERTYLETSIAERETRRERELDTAQEPAETEKQRAEEHSRTAGRLRRWVVFVTGALVVAGASATMASLFSQRATQNANTAQQQARLATSRELAAAALNNLEADPERSVLLALRALSTAHTLEAENALHQTVPALRLLRTFRHPNFVVTAISSDGTRLATTSKLDW